MVEPAVNAEPPTSPDRDVRRCRAAERKIWPHLAEALARIHGNKLWKEIGYESWHEYLAQPEIAVSQSTASKLIRVYRHYTQAGVSVDELQEHSWPKLYEAIAAADEWDVTQTLAYARLPMTELKALIEDMGDTDPVEHAKCVCVCGHVHRPKKAAVSRSKEKKEPDGDSPVQQASVPPAGRTEALTG